MNSSAPATSSLSPTRSCLPRLPNRQSGFTTSLVCGVQGGQASVAKGVEATCPSSTGIKAALRRRPAQAGAGGQPPLPPHLVHPRVLRHQLRKVGVLFHLGHVDGQVQPGNPLDCGLEQALAIILPDLLARHLCPGQALRGAIGAGGGPPCPDQSQHRLPHTRTPYPGPEQ